MATPTAIAVESRAETIVVSLDGLLFRELALATVEEIAQPRSIAAVDTHPLTPIVAGWRLEFVTAHRSDLIP